MAQSLMLRTRIAAANSKTRLTQKVDDSISSNKSFFCVGYNLSKEKSVDTNVI
jgi:hypothetical protein